MTGMIRRRECWFVRSPKRLEAVGGAGGALIVGLGASIAVEQGVSGR